MPSKKKAAVRSPTPDDNGSSTISIGESCTRLDKGLEDSIGHPTIQGELHDRIQVHGGLTCTLTSVDEFQVTDPLLPFVVFEAV